MPDRHTNPVRLDRRYVVVPQARAQEGDAKVPLDVGRRPLDMADSELVRPCDLGRGILFDDFLSSVNSGSSPWTKYNNGSANAGIYNTESAFSSIIALDQAMGAVRLTGGSVASGAATMTSNYVKAFKLSAGMACEMKYWWGITTGSKLRFGFGRITSAVTTPAAAPYLYFEADDATGRFAALKAGTVFGATTSSVTSGLYTPSGAATIVRIEVESATEANLVFASGVPPVSDYYAAQLTTGLPTGLLNDDVGVWVSIENGSGAWSSVDIDYISVYRWK